MTGIEARITALAPGNLPLAPTPFIGREREIQAARDLLARQEVRLVTLTGPGGTGKTRLAMEVARSLRSRFPNGVFFVALAPVTDPALVPASIAQALSIAESGSRPLTETLTAYLVDKRALLLLDNFEQILE